MCNAVRGHSAARGLEQMLRVKGSIHRVFSSKWMPYASLPLRDSAAGSSARPGVAF